MCAIGLVVLLQLNTTTILLGLASLPLVLLYPLAKRITWWPQLVLGLVFNWGALMGDDALVGVKSSALRLGDRSGWVIALLYATAITFWFAAGWQAHLGLLYFVGLVGAAVHFAWQLKRLDINAPDTCLRLFKSNIHFGWIVFLAIILGSYNIIQ